MRSVVSRMRSTSRRRCWRWVRCWPDCRGSCEYRDVIPGRAESANPESRSYRSESPGSLAWRAPRNGVCLTPTERIIPLVFPVAALVLVGDFHRHHIFRVLESELGWHADLHREAIGARQDLVCELERHLGLRMQRGAHVERRIVAVLVGALEPDVARLGVCPDQFEEIAQGCAGP